MWARRDPDGLVGFAFLPLAAPPTYSATKAAIHSYSRSLRHQLRDTSIHVHEIVPPYVQIELMGPGQASDPDAMPLADFIAETMHLLEEQPDAREILARRVMPPRRAAIDGRFDQVFQTLNGGGHRSCGRPGWSHCGQSAQAV